MRKILSVLLVLTMLVACALPTSAAPGNKASDVYTYSMDRLLFNTEINANEVLIKSKVTTKYYSLQIEMVTTDREFVRRNFEGTVTITSDTRISDIVTILVDKDCKLVVEKGATLQIDGALEINGGILENKGTIIVGNTGSSGFSEAKTTQKAAILRNRGDFQNTGSVSIKHGTIENEGQGVLTNTGTLTVANKTGDLIGVINDSIFDGTKQVPGTINNTGTIHLQNETGLGIWNISDAVIQNDGKIIKSGGGNVKGTIKGNAVTTE